MAIDKVREYFRQYNMEDRIREFEVSSATVELAVVVFKRLSGLAGRMVVWCNGVVVFL